MTFACKKRDTNTFYLLTLERARLAVSPVCLHAKLSKLAPTCSFILNEQVWERCQSSHPSPCKKVYFSLFCLRLRFSLGTLAFKILWDVMLGHQTQTAVCFQTSSSSAEGGNKVFMPQINCGRMVSSPHPEMNGVPCLCFCSCPRALDSHSNKCWWTFVVGNKHGVCARRCGLT